MPLKGACQSGVLQHAAGRWPLSSMQPTLFGHESHLEVATGTQLDQRSRPGRRLEQHGGEPPRAIFLAQGRIGSQGCLHVRGLSKGVFPVYCPCDRCPANPIGNHHLGPKCPRQQASPACQACPACTHVQVMDHRMLGVLHRSREHLGCSVGLRTGFPSAVMFGLH
jgi:hypothetical protein